MIVVYAGVYIVFLFVALGSSYDWGRLEKVQPLESLDTRAIEKSKAWIKVSLVVMALVEWLSR